MGFSSTDSRSAVPKVSVVTTVFNDEKYIGEAVQSILDQTYKDFELIIIDDGSTDNTPKVIEAFTDPRIRLHSQPNKGITPSANRGLLLSRGEYVARQDSDDISMPHRLDAQVRFLDEHPDVGAYGSSSIEISESGRQVRLMKAASTLDEINARLQNLNVPFAQSSAMFRRDLVWGVLGGYNEMWPKAEDYELWLRISEHSVIAASDGPFIKYRHRRGSATRADSDFLQLEYAVLGLISSYYRRKTRRDIIGSPLWSELVEDIRSWLRSDGYTSRASAKRHFGFFRTNLRDGRIVAASVELLRALKKDPWLWRYRGTGLNLGSILDHLTRTGSLAGLDELLADEGSGQKVSL